MIPPGKTIGILGGGPTARLLSLAAARLGYRVAIYSPRRDAVASSVSARTVYAAYSDREALAAFARECDVLTSDSEQIPVEPLWDIEKLVPLRPHWNLLELAQSRIREKNWLAKNGFVTTPFAEVEAGDDLRAAIRRVGMPCLLKPADGSTGSAAFMRVNDEASAEQAPTAFAGRRVLVERLVDFKCELSVAVARTADGECSAFPAGENIYTRHRLEFSIVPARVSTAAAIEASKIARTLAERLGMAGLLTVRFFLTDRGELLINGFSPRPHPCSHYTTGAYALSHVEQHIRAICSLPLGTPHPVSPASSVAIPADAAAGRALPWEVILRDENAVLLCHGTTAESGELAHFTVRAGSVEAAIERARMLKARLLRAETAS